MKKIDGRYLRHLREKHGYSLREFAEKIYSSKSTVQRWEKSYLPEENDILKKIADIFSMTVDEMREQSVAQYDNEQKAELTAEQLAEIKFSTKWLIIPIIALFIFSIIIMLISFL